MQPIKSLYNFLKEEYVILTAFGLGLFLRLVGSLQNYLVFDENLWVDAANKVSFSPKRFNLLLHGAFHPFFEVYLIKLSTLLFDNKFFGFIPEYLRIRFSIRFLHVILSSATIIVIYYLVKNGLGKSQAAFAALFIAFSQFHIHFSRTVIQTAPLLFFVTLALFFFWKAVHEGKGRFIILTGLAIGFGYLCEETAALLFIVFAIFLIITKRCIQWLKKWETYTAILGFFLIISPDLYWNISSQSSDIKYHLTRAARFKGISLLPTCLFVGELFLKFIKDLEVFFGGFGRNICWTLEYPTMHWIFGVMCLVAVIASLRKWKNEFVKLMLITFFSIFLFFTFFASSGPLGNFNFWWASISFIPAVVLVSDMFSEIFHRNLFLKCFSIIFVFYIFCHSVYFLSIDDNIYVRRPSFLASYYINCGRCALIKGEIEWAIKNLEKALKYKPESVTALVNLEECFKRKGQELKYESIWKKYQGKDILFSNKSHLLLDRGYIKEWLISKQYKVCDLNADEIDDLSIVESLLVAIKDDDTGNNKFEKLISTSGFIDLKRFLKNPSKGFSYALTHIYSPVQQEAAFLVGADDGTTMWLNQEKIFQDNEKLLWFPDEDTINVTLIQGWNELLLRIVYNGGNCYGFTVRIADRSGEIMDTLESKAFPNETNIRKMGNQY